MQACPMCGDQFSPSLLKLHQMLEKKFVEQARRQHPDWDNSKLLQEYKTRHERYKKEAYEIRLKLVSGLDAEEEENY
ncbi:MAG: hypothetical protein RMM17_02675 [Acidobacteriota bacterium]|nr:hypothetical protein [Blastocatellia bacterium]MDW8411572.1 hypothetical protein [Acidobacteriota bacterium]